MPFVLAKKTTTSPIVTIHVLQNILLLASLWRLFSLHPIPHDRLEKRNITPLQHFKGVNKHLHLWMMPLMLRMSGRCLHKTKQEITWGPDTNGRSTTKLALCLRGFIFKMPYLTQTDASRSIEGFLLFKISVEGEFSQKVTVQKFLFFTKETE